MSDSDGSEELVCPPVEPISRKKITRKSQQHGQQQLQHSHARQSEHPQHQQQQNRRHQQRSPDKLTTNSQHDHSQQQQQQRRHQQRSPNELTRPQWQDQQRKRFYRLQRDKMQLCCLMVPILKDDGVVQCSLCDVTTTIEEYQWLAKEYEGKQRQLEKQLAYCCVAGSIIEDGRFICVFCAATSSKEEYTKHVEKHEHNQQRQQQQREQQQPHQQHAKMVSYEHGCQCGPSLFHSQAFFIFVLHDFMTFFIVRCCCCACLS
jgi:DNA mismatch repair ATPase MutL